MRKYRGALKAYGKDRTFVLDEAKNLDEALEYCFCNYNWPEILEVTHLILPNDKILNQRNIEKLWERMSLCSIGNNYFFSGG